MECKPGVAESVKLMPSLRVRRRNPLTSFLYLLHTHLWVLVFVGWLCDLGQKVGPLWASCFTETPMGQVTLPLGDTPGLGGNNSLVASGTCKDSR